MTVAGDGWGTLGYKKNPIDADPDTIQLMSTDWQSTAEALQELCSNVDRTQTSDIMQSDAFDKTREHGQELSKKLKKYHERYSEASTAAATFQGQISEDIEKAEAIAARAAQLNHLKETQTDQTTNKTSLTPEAQDQEQQLEQYKRDLDAVVKDAKDHAKQMTSALHDANSLGKDTCMDKFKHFLKIILKVLMIIAIALSVIGFLVPGLNMVMIAGLVVDTMSLVFTAVSYGVGQSSLFDLIMGIVGFGMSAFSAFRSFKGLSHDAKLEGFAGKNKIRNGKEEFSEGRFRRPEEMSSGEVAAAGPGGAKQAARDAAQRETQERFAKSQSSEDTAASKERDAQAVEQREPSEEIRSDPERLRNWNREQQAEADGLRRESSAAHEQAMREDSEARRLSDSSEAYSQHLETSNVRNLVNYIWTKDIMRLGRYSGRARWTLSGSRGRAALSDKTMPDYGGVPKPFPKPEKLGDTIKNGIKDRLGFRESRSFAKDHEKFATPKPDSEILVAREGLPDLRFKSDDGRLIRHPWTMVGRGAPTDVQVNLWTLRVLNSIDAARKTWGVVKNIGTVWEYDGNVFGPQKHQTPWTRYNKEHPRNPNWSQKK